MAEAQPPPQGTLPPGALPPGESRWQWPVGKPADVGMDASALAALDQDFRSGKYGFVDSMFVARQGVAVAEAAYQHDYETAYAGRNPIGGMHNYYDPAWHPYLGQTRLHTMQSVTKTITSILIGIARTRGEFPGLDTPALDFFPAREIANLDARKQRITVRHLLTMTAGFEWDEMASEYTDPRNNCAAMEKCDDWVRYALDQPMAAEPGTVYVYSSGVTQLLAEIFQQATGKDIGAYAEASLFAPLGILENYWKRTPLGLADTEGGLYLHPSDLARLGVLWLQGGEWQGRRIVSAEWVAESVVPAIVASPVADYGFQWWLYRYGSGQRSRAWVMSGYGGQRLIVIPEHHIAAVFTGWNIDEHPRLPIEDMLDRIVAAVVG